MEFRLNETQSYDILRHFDAYEDLIKLINEHAYDIMMRYYNQYLSDSSNWIWKPKKPGQFFSAIAKSNSSFEVRKYMDQKLVFSYNDAEFDINKLQKYKTKYEPIALEVVHEALNCPYFFGNAVAEINKIHEILLKFGTMPYTVDQNILEKYLKIKEVNEKRLKILNNIGVKYEL